MRSIVINGGVPIHGRVSVSGSKNAALPIIFSTVIIDGVSRIENLPDIGDVRVALDIIREFGARIFKSGDVTLIDTTELSYTTPNVNSVCRIRASTYLIGACLSRFGVSEIMDFGGCNFSERPIDLHLAAARALGAEFDGKILNAKALLGGEINLPMPSVGATVNAILLATSAEGETVIRGSACEPHIDALIDFLVSAGADIRRRESDIIINGRKLHGGKIRIPGDMIEAGTFLALGALSREGITVTGADTEELSAVLGALSSLGAEVSVTDGGITTRRGKKGNYAELVAEPYPGFPTDLQPVFSVLMHVSGGKITDNVWRERFGYLNSLSHFGLIFERESNSARIYPSVLKSATVSAPDLRGGMACIMAALLAKGRSTVGSAHIIERGYENLEEKLCALGADFKNLG